MPARRYRVTLGDHTLEVELREQDGSQVVVVDGQELVVELGPPDAGGLRRLRLGEQRFELIADPRRDSCTLALGGLAARFEVEDERHARLARFGGGGSRGSGSLTVVAPMPGLVVRVNVQAGEQVAAGDCLVVLQAMKMENEIAAPRDGTVSRVAVEAGQPVEHRAALVELA